MIDLSTLYPCLLGLSLRVVSRWTDYLPPIFGGVGHLLVRLSDFFQRVRVDLLLGECELAQP